MYPDQNQRIKDYKNMVSSYYDIITEPYRLFWGDFFHPAIYDDPNDDFETALLKTHERMLRDSRLKPGDKAIDLGCGTGSLARFISTEADCEVLGITISDFQIHKSRELARKNKADNVSFANIDIMELDKSDELDGKFDAAFLIDVGGHLPDKGKAIKNISKILKKGGRLIVTDWLQKESPNYFEKQLLIEPFNMYWSFSFMGSMSSSIKTFKKHGFKVIKAEDVTDKTKKNWEEFYNVAVREINNLSLKRMSSFVKNPAVLLNNRRFMQVTKDQFYANVFTKVCYDAGVFKYGYFVLER